MRSIEGKVGEPRAKYVHATDKGLFDLPTVLNNVETWADVGAILDRGGAWFASHRHGEVEGHEGVLAGRQGEEHRASSSCRWG